MTAEAIITCPKCEMEIKLTESLAAPLVESLRRDYEDRLAQKDATMASRETALRERETAIARAKESLDEQVAEKMKQQRVRIAAEEGKKARLAFSADLDQKSRELVELHDVLKTRDQKLAEAQQAQAELIRKERELDDARREMDLTVEKRVQENLTVTRDQARKEAEESLKFKVMEKEQTITSMQKQIEEPAPSTTQAGAAGVGTVRTQEKSVTRRRGESGEEWGSSLRELRASA